MNSALPLADTWLRAKYPVARLLTPGGGLLSGVRRLGAEPTSVDLHACTAHLGNLTAIYPDIVHSDGSGLANEIIGGAGADQDPELAWIRAVMEGAERYACMLHLEDEFITASAHELGSAALDLDTVPRCSARERADPRCLFALPDKAAPIRWVKGYSLTARQPRLVPAVMSHLHLRPGQGENFCDMISTGVAAHFDLEAALVSAICESIERDAIAITWLAQLALPRIEMPVPPPPVLGPNLGRLAQSPLRHLFFDATTDLGIPTVYALQLLDGHPHLAQYVNCATDFNAAACAKTIREAAPARPVFEDGYRYPAEVRDFSALHDGAAYLGRAAMRHEFDFLVNSGRTRRLEQVEIAQPQGSGARLRTLIGRLRAMDMEAVAVDLTTDELRELGVWVVRVVIPGLMPMSTHYRGRFLGHPRLYDYARKAGRPDFCEDHVNPAPQPFA